MLSIRRVLLFWLLGIVLFGVVLAGVLIYRQAQSEANALFDYQLQQTAAALPSEPFSSVLGNTGTNAEGVVIQIWSRDGAQLYYSRPRAPLAPRAELGFSTEHTPAGDWRVYSAIVGDNVVQLAQPMAIRNVLAAETAWRTVWPLLILLPVLGIGVWLIVGRGLRPLSRLARVLELRRPEAVDPLPDRKLPPEIRPVIHALNGLLQRLNVAFDTQKAFVADAAHELRTPLAALRIQTQLLERAGDDAARGEALADLKNGVERATRLVEQLLSMARAESVGIASTTAIDASGSRSANDSIGHNGSERAAMDGVSQVGAIGGSDGPYPHGVPSLATPAANEGVDLQRLVESCVALHASLAIDKGVDLGIEHAGPARIDGDAESLRVMIGNLLDNAVKYTPPGGRVDVSVGQRASSMASASSGSSASSAAMQAYVDIIDTGPGIAPSERQRVFDRFYRSPQAMGVQTRQGATTTPAAPSNASTNVSKDASTNASTEATAPEFAVPIAQGSGLGLAIVKRIADRHHAQILLADRPDGNGSGLHVTVLFTLRLT